MDRLINLTRAARLVGVTRAALQKKIKDGVLPTFEGMVTEEGLLQAFPNTSFEDNTSFERMAQTKLVAHYARAAERLPSKEVLAMRINALAKDLSDAKGEARRYRAIAARLEERLKEWDNADEAVQAAAASLRAWLHQAFQESDSPTPDGFRNLTIRDSFLRIMASHVTFQPSGHEFFVEGSDTVLESALRAGLAPNYGCSNGKCGRCKARVVSGELLQVRPHEYDLSEEEKSSGYALMCSNTAVSDVVVEAGEARAGADIPHQQVTAHVKSVTPLGEEMLLLQLQTPLNTRLRFLSGQNVVLGIGQSLTAEYPIAGCPCDDRNLPFHIPRKAGHYFSEYVAGKLAAGDAVTLDGPSGEFVLRGDSSRSMIFIAFGIGFAPMKGMMEQALALDTGGAVHLYWVVSRESQLYFASWPRAMQYALDNFHYTPLVVASNLETAAGRRDQLVGGVLQRIEDECPDLNAFDVYVAGPEPLVDAGRRWLLERGVPETQLVVGAVR
jgi:CDP-4-dehydro-6-deoxyglucose reductase